jgi:CRISPR-associated endonuclease Csy4
MNYYIELTLINDKEFGFSELWSVFFTQLHLAFVEQKDANEQIPYGVSFPEYKLIQRNDKLLGLLGSKLRVFANTQQELEALALEKWLVHLADYVHIKSARPVGEVSTHLLVSRYRLSSNIEKVAQRFARFKNITYDAALKHCLTHKKGWEDYPYIGIKSLSNKNRFNLAIKQQAVETAVSGKFSTYGLSATSTVPHW